MSSIEQARRFLAAGRLREAGSILSDLVRRNSSDSTAMQLLGVVQFQGGYRKEGQKLVERALGSDPGNWEAWNNLGLIHHLQGEHEAALKAFAEAVRLKGDYAEAWRNHGFLLQKFQRHADALQSFDRAGEGSGVEFFRGNSLSALGRYGEAIEVFDSVLAKQPERGEVWLNRASALAAANRIPESLESYGQAIHRLGRSPEAHCSLALTLRKAGRLDEAVTVLKQVRSWHPDYEPALELLTTFESELGQLEARASRPDLTPTDRVELAKHLQGLGKWRQAVDALHAETSAPARFVEALLLPAIFETPAEPDEALEHLTVAVGKLLEDPPALDDPLREVGMTMFHLPYFGIRERSIQQDIAGLYREAAPSLRFEAGHSLRAGRRRIGVLSESLREHTISRVFGGLIERLDKERFETVYLQLGPSDAWSERIARSADRHLHLSLDLAESREEVAREELDVLFYPEIGMDPQTYYLAFSRLAPIQATTWGHPLTTGSPTMDYFLSSEHFEAEGAEQDYSEKLIRLPSIPMYYSRPESPSPRERIDFDLPENRRIYGCPQMAYKFHPRFDAVLGQILERDPEGVLVLIEPRHTHYKKILEERWKRFPSLVGRVIWLPQMSLSYYLAMLPLMDALIAPTLFGGGRSSLDAFAMGQPVVTFRGGSLKSRITYGMYRQAGLEGLVAETEGEYVAIAHRLATDVEWRTEMRRQTLGRTGALFEHGKAVAEFNDCLATLRALR